MQTKLFGAAVYGVKASSITIEVSVHSGFKYFVVGLPDNAVKESLQRMESAVKHLGYSMPKNRMVINLSPADLRKEGSGFDLPMTLGMLLASGQIQNTLQQPFMLMGELALDGSILPVKGALPMAVLAREEGYEFLFLPLVNFEEATVVQGVHVVGVSKLQEIIDFVSGRSPVPLNPPTYQIESISPSTYAEDFEEVKGQENIKRALESALS